LQRVAAVEKAVDAGHPDTLAAYSVALDAIRGALDAGRPFEAELAAAKRLGGAAAQLGPLDSLAAKGAPSIPALAAGFEAAAPAIVAVLAPKEAPAAPDSGVGDRLWSSLSRVVSVTREGEQAGDEATRPVGQIREALQHGDLEAAVATFEAMPPAAQQAGATWLNDARSTLAAQATVRSEMRATLQKLAAE
jgi:hypothetical protein